MSGCKISTAIESAMRAYSPPLGSRLTPEQDLAKTLGVGRFHIRRAMDELVDKGLVFRRRGSGTYIKALPERVVAEAESSGEGLSINPEHLFAVEQADSAARPTEGPASLRIGLWSDLANMPATHHRVLAGASQRAGEQNQYLSVHSIVRSRDVPLSVEELGRQVRAHPAEVYIVAERWADEFNQAFGGSTPPAVYFNSSRPLHRYEPVVGLDNEGVVEAGIRQLATAGHRKIGMLALDTPGRPLWAEVEAYRRTLRREDLEYQNIQTCKLLDRQAARQAGQALLAGPERPEAVYVGDDHLLEGFLEAVQDQGLQIGRDLAVVTLSNAGVPLPPTCNWSRVEFDLVALGELLIDTAQRLVRQGPERTSSCLLRHKWIAGQSHLRTAIKKPE